MKKHLNLDSQFAPLGNSISFEHFTFSGGEPHIRITEDLANTETVIITTRIRSFNDMGLLLLATDALKRMGIRQLELVLPYFPAARQDRAMNTGEALSVKVYAELINQQQYQKVTILDPHSEVTPALLENVQVVSNESLVKQALAELSDYVIVSPDGGALKKIYNVAKALGGVEVIECTKKRNVATGQLTGFKVYADDLKGQTCVIIDDICDGGGTFLGLAEQLRNHNAGELILVVTHGIFSNGTERLKEHFSEIICTDSFRTIEDENITQIKLDTTTLK